MKRIVSFALALLLIMSVSITETYALSNNFKGLPPGLAKKGSLPPGIEKKFKDINGYDWAEKAIEKMAIKGVIQGYGEGIYAPKNSVTKLEAIIMALRVMGYEELAKINLEKIRKGTKKLKNKSRVQDWAYGYVAVALEKGILDEVDLIEMDLRAPAQRHEVAKYIIRALGYEKEAQKYMKTELRFIDAGAVPLGSVGYVYLADKKGIITGYPDETFRPNRSVTRAEMAVLIARLDDKVDSDIDENEELAEIIKISGNKLTLKNDNGTKVYRVLENAPVYTENGKYVSIEELEKGMKIKIQLNDDRIIIFIEIKEYEDEKIFEEYIGIVEEIDDDEIEIKINTINMEFDVEDDVKVEFNNKWGSIDDIKEGDKVKVRINDDDEVEYIKVYRALDIIHYEGKVEDLDNDSITIKVERIKMTFGLASNVKVKFKNREGSISDIRVGDTVKVRINKYERVEYIEVNRNLDTWHYEGKVESVNNDNIAIKIDRVKMIFEYANNVKVKFKNREGSISDIRVGDTVKVRINKYKRVEYIEVSRNLDTWHYEGKVEDIDNDDITIKVDRIRMTFDLASNAKVRFKNTDGSIEDIKIGDEVKIGINEEEKVEYIEVDRELNSREYEGKVEKIDNDYDWIEIQIGSKDRRFEITDETEVVFDNDAEGDIEDIKVGDEAYVRVNIDDELEYIEVDRELYFIYEGEVEEIDDDYDWIEIDMGNIDRRFEITDETEVIFEGDVEGDIEDIKVGDDAYVRVNADNELEYIKVDRELDYDIFEGLFIEIEDEKLSIIESNKIIEFRVDSDIKVKFADKVGDLEDLIVGDVIKVITLKDDDEVKWIEVDRNYSTTLITGKLINIYEDENQIAIRQNDKIEIYDYKSTVKVFINDDEAELLDLEEDDSLYLILDEDKVKEIRVYRLIIED